MPISQLMTRRQFAALAAAVDVRPLPPLRLALIGLDGHPTEILSQLPHLPQVTLAGWWASAEAPAAMLRNQFLAKSQRYDDYRELLKSEKLDVVAVCNDNGGRAEAVLAALAKGVPVIAEKPLALRKPDLERIRTAVTRRNLALGMLLPMRYERPYLALREIVRSGAIGEVVQIDMQKSYQLGDRPKWMRERPSYGGTIPWIGPHGIDLIRWTSGRDLRAVSSLTGHVGQPEAGAMENTTVSIFRLDNGGTATLRMDYFRPATAGAHGDDRLRLAGTKGVAEYQEATGVTLLSAAAPPQKIVELPPAGSVFRDFLQATFAGAAPTLSATDIWRVNEATLAAQTAAETGHPIQF